MVELAGNYGTGPVLMEGIARGQGISRKYLHALLTRLKSAGLVRSVRGAGGGYSLARAPSQIRLDEVVRILEGSLSVVDCVEDIEVCARVEGCVTRDVWRDLTQLIEGFLASMTLEDLVVRKRAKYAGPPMYHIQRATPEGTGRAVCTCSIWPSARDRLTP